MAAAMASAESSSSTYNSITFISFDTPSSVTFPSYAPYHDKIISFCLWGGSEGYNYMALENVLVAQRIYPDWMCYIFYNSTCIPKIINALKLQPNVRMIEIHDKISKASNMFWRFIPCFESDGIVLIRDCDSVLNEREKAAVDEFLDSSCNFHIMRDSIYHRDKILGGMWGCRNGILKPVYHHFYTFIADIKVGDDKRCLDQKWLDKEIYPRIKDSLMVHASANKYEKDARPFPPSCYKRPVGAIILHAPLSREVLGEENIKLSRQPQYKY